MFLLLSITGSEAGWWHLSQSSAVPLRDRSPAASRIPIRPSEYCDGRGTNVICRYSRSPNVLKSIGAAYIAFVWIPCCSLCFFFFPFLPWPNCTFTSTIAIICRSCSCALPRTVPPVGRPQYLKCRGGGVGMKHFADNLPLKVPHCANLT